MSAHREPTTAPATGAPPPAVAAGVGAATHQPGVTGRVAPAGRGEVVTAVGGAARGSEAPANVWAWAEAICDPAGAALPAGSANSTRPGNANGHNPGPRPASVPADRFDSRDVLTTSDDLRSRLATPAAEALAEAPVDHPPQPTIHSDDPSPRSHHPWSHSPAEPGGRGVLACILGPIEALNERIRRALTSAQWTVLTCTLSIGPRRTVVNLGIVNLDHPYTCPHCGAPVVPCHRTEV